MALFSKKIKKGETKAENEKSLALRSLSGAGDLSHILQHARITEKATMHSTDSVYTFDVATFANKKDIMKAVQAIYKVTPRMVRVVTVPEKKKRNMRTGRIGIKRGGKKAYVYLKRGETITLS